MESSIDVAIAVGSLAADSHETPARLHPPTVIVETGDLRIALLREVFRTIQQLKEVHSTRIIAMLCACQGIGIADVPTKELAAEGCRKPDRSNWYRPGNGSLALEIYGLALGPPIPRKTSMARFNLTMSSSARRPISAPIFVLETVFILSTIKRHGARRPFASLGSMGSRNRGASVGLVVNAHTVTDLVVSKRSSCRTITGRGLPA